MLQLPELADSCYTLYDLSDEGHRSVARETIGAVEASFSLAVEASLMLGHGRGCFPFMKFESILFETPEDRAGMQTLEMPGFFVDLNLDQIVESATKGKEEYDLRPFFWSPLQRVGAIEYRQEVMQELEGPDTARIVGVLRTADAYYASLSGTG